jgi:hypothetical protein
MMSRGSEKLPKRVTYYMTFLNILFPIFKFVKIVFLSIITKEKELINFISLLELLHCQSNSVVQKKISALCQFHQS